MTLWPAIFRRLPINWWQRHAIVILTPVVTTTHTAGAAETNNNKVKGTAGCIKTLQLSNLFFSFHGKIILQKNITYILGAGEANDFLAVLDEKAPKE